MPNALPGEVAIDIHHPLLSLAYAGAEGGVLLPPKQADLISFWVAGPER